MSQPQAGRSLPSPDADGLRLSLRHLTRFEYDGVVQDSFNDVRLCPVSDPLQRCEAFELAA